MKAAFTLRPLAPADSEFAYSLETDRTRRARGRLAGRVPSRAEFESILWRNVHAQFVVVGGDHDIGVAAIYEADYVNGVAYAYVIAVDDSAELAFGAKAALFDFAFAETPFRRLYDGSPDMVVDAAGGPSPSETLLPLRREGLLRGHYLDGDGFLDKPVVSVSRDDWSAFRRADVDPHHAGAADPWKPAVRDPAPNPAAEPPPVAGTLARPLVARHVFLRPITHGDYESLMLAELSPELGPRWRHRGGTPSPEAFAQTLFAGVLAQFLVVDREHGRPIGLVSVYHPDPINQHAYIALARLPGSSPRTRVIEGMLLFLDYVFECWPFRKLYAEALEFNFDQFSSGSGRMFDVEARLPERAFFASRMWDQFIIAITRESWAEYGQRMLAVVVDHQ
jgi:hypothetical protein